MSVALLVEQIAESYTTQPRTGDKGTHRRIIISPNLLFESSRSSLAEGTTTQGSPVQVTPVPGALSAASSGAGASEAGAAATGERTDIKLSSVLLDHLARRGVSVVGTVAQRLWGFESAGPEGSAAPTWVERVVAAAQKRQLWRTAEETPTAALAVRQFKFELVPQQLVVDRSPSTKELEVRLRTHARERSICPGLTTEVLVLHLSAELVGVSDGRIIGRVEEHKTPLATLVPRRKLVFEAPNNEEARDQAACEAIKKELTSMREFSSRWPELKSFVNDQLRAGLDGFL
jgi:hypothetical protein